MSSGPGADKNSPFQLCFSEPLYFFDPKAVDADPYATCTVCKEECHAAIRRQCTSCPDFNVCIACFQDPEFAHTSHCFDEIDLGYPINKSRKKDWGGWPDVFVRPNVFCYTCFDHRPNNLRAALFVKSLGKVIDAAGISDERYLECKSFASGTGISDTDALFLLDRHDWNTANAREALTDDFSRYLHESNRRYDVLESSEFWHSKHQFRESDLARSTAKGCQLCSLVYRGVTAVLKSKPFLNRSVRIFIKPNQIRILVPVENWFLEEDWYLSTLAGADPPWPKMKTLPDYSDHFGSEKCFDKLRSWIQECETSHPHDNCTGADQLLPRRLLSVSNEHPDGRIKLVELSEQCKGRYIALSHCWGALPTLKTMASNITDMYKDINPEGLPKTFRDAVQCARMLNIQFLWIDSLCIVQDDPADWEREAAKMCDYYQNAWLVVVAASARGDTSGFLGARPEMCMGFPLESKEGSGDFDTCFHRKMPHIEDGVYPRTDLKGGFTGRRAWCLQETFLARRSVTFHKEEMAWSCFTTSNCECGIANDMADTTYEMKSGQVMKEKRHYRPQRSLRNRFSDASGTFGDFYYYRRPFTHITSPAGLYEEWRAMIVPSYTNRSLTHQRDKLPALSGLAKLMKARTKSSYLAGIWSDDIQLGLLWEIHSGREAPAQFDLGAPSFSWASVDQPISYQIPGFVATDSRNSALGDVRVDLLDFFMERAESNEYGAVSSGYVKLSGLVSRVCLTWDNHRFKLQACGDFQLLRLQTYPYTWETFQLDTYLRKVDVERIDNTMISSMRRSDIETDWPTDFETTVDCLIVSDIRTPAASRYHMDQNCQEYAVLLLGKVRFENNIWTYQRLGKAVLVFEPGDGTKWLAQATQQEVILI